MLFEQAPPALLKSRLVNEVLLGELDITRISERKLAFEVRWINEETKCTDEAGEQSGEKFGGKATYQSASAYSNAPSEVSMLLPSSDPCPPFPAVECILIALIVSPLELAQERQTN